MKTENFSAGKNDVSMEMQVMNAIDLQNAWSDNQVSITVTFNKQEAKHLKDVLQFCENKLKGVSFLPDEDHGYKQPPYEKITREKYDEMVSVIKPIDWNGIRAGYGVRGCDGDQCTL
jgi:sulfatase maturation enzyme AslB (radical SAM superfamily)